MAIEKEDYVTPSAGYLITKHGEFNPDLIHKTIVGWYEKWKYTFTEKENTEKMKPQGNDLNLKLDGERKIDDYAEFHIEVVILVYELRKKGTSYTGKMKINVRGFVLLDYRNNWGKTPFTTFLFHIYNNYIIKKRIKDYYEDNLEDEVKELTGKIKNMIGLHD